MTPRRAATWVALSLAGLVVVGGALWLGLVEGRREPAAAARPAPAVPDPELREMEPQVAELLREARQELLDHTDSGEAWGQLGALYDAHGLLEAAETCYRRARELAPKDFRWTYLLAVALEIHGAEAGELTELFAEAARLRPDYAQIYLRLGDALSRRGSYEQARGQFERALALVPAMAPAHRGLGQVSLRLGELELAVASLERAAELEPRDRAAWSALAQAYTRLGDGQRAARAAERAAGLEPVSAIDDPVYGQLVFDRSVSSTRMFRRAMSRFNGGDYAAAAADFEKVLLARPDDASAHYWLGVAARRMGHAPSAISHLSRAVELSPAMVKARTELAELHLAEERYEEADAQYREALRFASNPGPIWLALAEVRLRRQDLPGIVEAYSRAGELKPLDAREQLNLGVALMRTGQPGKAIEHYRESLRLRPANANVHYNIGVAYELMGEPEAASAQFREAARLDPALEAARRRRD